MCRCSSLINCFAITGILFFLSLNLFSQTPKYTHADSLKGSIGKARDWWDVSHYELHVKFTEADSTVSGYNIISYKVLREYPEMQLDLMEPMHLDSILQDGKKLGWRKDGDAYFVKTNPQKIGEMRNMTAWFHGRPRVAKNPPWDGGVVWKKDKNNNSWISVACQGMAARVWFPDKDHMYDEPDSVSIYIEAPKDLIAVSNGRLRGVKQKDDGSIIYNWAVMNPINV